LQTITAQRPSRGLLVLSKSLKTNTHKMVEEGDAIAQAEQEQPQVCSNLLPSKEEVQLSPPNPPDKGYAWLIVLGSFLCNALVDGFCFSFGVMRDHIATSFVGASDSQLSFAGSSLTGAYLLMGPISSALANTFGSRPVVMAGSVLACLSFFIASYLTNFYAFVAIFGVLGGISFGLVYLPAVVTVGFWFESRRAFATGIAVCGSGIGTAIFSVLIDRQLSTSLARYAYDPGSLNGWIITTANRVEPPPPDFDDQPVMSSDALHRIAETVLRRKTNASRRLANRSSAALNDSNAAAAAAAANSAAAATAATNNSAATAAATPGNAAAMKSSVPQLVRDYSQSQTSLNNSPSMEQPQRQQQLSVSSEPQSPEHSRFVSGVDLHRCSTGPDDVAGNTSWLSRRKEMLRPMNRKDVFHSGSLHQLNEYTRSKMSVAGTREYYRSVTSIPPDAGRPAAPAKSAIKQMLDVSILKSPTFCLLLVSSVLTMLGFLQFYQFIKGYAMKRGIPHNDATLLVTLIGVANTVGRIVAGWASDRSWATRCG
uniref:MFS domain-containing protein n=1 Tax=Macrostomum lignano TaxID=282301 RepID=A0A1I8FHC8_9PLAT